MEALTMNVVKVKFGEPEKEDTTSAHLIFHYPFTLTRMSGSAGLCAVSEHRVRVAISMFALRAWSYLATPESDQDLIKVLYYLAAMEVLNALLRGDQLGEMISRDVFVEETTRTQYDPARIPDPAAWEHVWDLEELRRQHRRPLGFQVP